MRRLRAIRRLRAEQGFTIVELLIVCVIATVVFGATLTAFMNATRAQRQTELQRDNADQARIAVDRAARQLRNLANPAYNATSTILRAEDLDFIFQTSDPAKTWVRYCLQTTGSGATPDSARLWSTESPSSTLPAGMDGPCPGTGWARGAVVAENVTNQAAGGDRNVFEYACSPGQPAGCPAGAADLPRITSVRFDLFVDRDTTDPAREMRVSTAVFLRNQNEAPTARARATPSSGSRRVLLNGTPSSDPEGRTLQYFWFTSTPPSSELAACNVTPPSARWAGPLLDHTFPAADGPAGTVKDFWLVVRDPGCLTSTIRLQVQIPT